MGIDTTFFPTTHSQSEGDKKPHTFIDAVAQVKANQRAVKLLDMVYPETIGDTKIALGMVRNKFKSAEDLEAALAQYVRENIGVSQNPSNPLSEAEFLQAIRDKQDQYKREAVNGIVNALKPLYEQFGGTKQHEQQKTSENSSERAKIRASFMRFLDTNGATIRDELTRGTSMEWIIYSHFYSQGDNENKISEGSHQEKVIKDRYLVVLQRANSDLEAVAKQHKISIVDNGYWKHAVIGRGLGKEKIGRIYLNVHPLDTPDIFRKAVELLAKNNIASQAKIPLEMDAAAVNRADKMVIYFAEQDDKRVLDILEQLNIENSQSFFKGSPQFSAGLTNSKGAELTGMAFGEDPAGGERSFGEVRSNILADLVKVANYQGLRLDDPRFQFDSLFTQACARDGVNKDNVAFNDPSNSGSFSEIRRRIKR